MEVLFEGGAKEKAEKSNLKVKVTEPMWASVHMQETGVVEGDPGWCLREPREEKDSKRREC